MKTSTRRSGAAQSKGSSRSPRKRRDASAFAVALDKGGDQYLLSRGYTKILDSDGNELWAKGALAVEKYMAARPELAADDRAS